MKALTPVEVKKLQAAAKVVEKLVARQAADDDAEFVVKWLLNVADEQSAPVAP